MPVSQYGLPNRREAIESPIEIGENETRADLTLDTTPYGGTPTNVALTVLNLSNNETDVTGTVVSGTSGVNGNVITLATIGNGGVARDSWYQILIYFENSDGDHEPYILAYCRR